MIRLDGSKSSLEAFASLRPSFEQLTAPVFVALPGTIVPHKLPNECRDLPPCVRPLLIAKGDIKDAHERSCKLSAGLGQPICGWHVADWQNYPHTDLPRFSHAGTQYLYGFPPLVADSFRIGSWIPLAKPESKKDEWTYIHGRTKSITVTTAAAQLSALSGTNSSRIPTAPPGGWLSGDQLTNLATELQTKLRIPQSAPISLADALFALATAATSPKATDILWQPALPPTAAATTDSLATTAGAIRASAQALLQDPSRRIPASISVNGYPASAETFLQTLASLVLSAAPDTSPLLIPRAAPIDDQSCRSIIRQLPRDQRQSANRVLHALRWDTARLPT